MAKIKFSGHTMGAPGQDIHQVIDLFHRIGYDGIEVRVANDGQIDSETITNAECRSILQEAKASNMEFSCLTSYYQNFASPELRDSVISNLKRVAEISAELDCPLIRVYGGVEPKALPDLWFADVWTRTVTGIQEVARYAAKFGVGVCIETHLGSLTMTVRDTVRLIEDVNMHNVGMLFDYAWVELAGVESGAEAVRLAARHISHVHIKDWVLKSRLPIAKTSCLMGKGTVRWEEVLPALKACGYSGYVSDEYEKYWYPEDLPEPEVGMLHNMQYCRKFLQD